MASGDFRPDLNIPHLLIHIMGLCVIYHSNRHSMSRSPAIDRGEAKLTGPGLTEALLLVFEGITLREAPAAARRFWE